jgi:purine-nucleoside phosphorylase
VSSYLRPTAPIAPEALLPGDPKRAMELATALMAKPLMSNLSRGLWGYSGATHDGRALTVQSTGIGGPSAAAVLGELAGEGVRTAVRIGTCTALDPGLAPGDALVVAEAIAADGVGSALEPDAESVPADRRLTDCLARQPGLAGPACVASTDLHGPPAHSADAWRGSGAIAFDLSAAALLAVGRRAGIAVGCALVVAESAAGERLSDEALDRAALDLGRRAAEAVAAAAQASAEGSSPA